MWTYIFTEADVILTSNLISDRVTDWLTCGRGGVGTTAAPWRLKGRLTFAGNDGAGCGVLDAGGSRPWARREAINGFSAAAGAGSDWTRGGVLTT